MRIAVPNQSAWGRERAALGAVVVAETPLARHGAVPAQRTEVAASCSPPLAAGTLQRSPSHALSQQVCVLLLMDVAKPWRAWGCARFVVTRFDLRALRGLRFFKMLGSGYEGGFGLKPSVSRQGLFCAFDTQQHAQEFLASRLIQMYRQRSAEFFSVILRPYSVKGAWAGFQPGCSAAVPLHGPVASLTRASIRIGAARRFWQNEPGAEAALAGSSGCLLAAGLGEAPLLRQATFSLWDGVASMDAYARSGAHLAAIRAAYAQNFFSESMFVRFVPQDLCGTYKGVRYG